MMRYVRLYGYLAVVLLSVSAVAAEPAPLPWDLNVLGNPPATYPAPGFEEAGVKALFYEGLPCGGKPTRVFAWYGAPAAGAPGAGGTKHPAMVLVHGGGGTAFANWVRLWNERGYAAIAMDTCGCIPRGTYGHWERHDMGGPAGWGGFDQTGQPPADQWTYHAIADVVLAHSLIRSYPEVDADRIGITGISWGGYLTCIAAGVDPRFKLAAPVYGCGYLGENSAWLDNFSKMGPETAAEWLSRWDPSVYLPRAAMPMLWITGTNDFAYPMDSLQKSYRLPTGPRALCIRVRMPHGHGPAGEGPEEIRAFADSILDGGAPLPSIIDQGRENNEVWVKFKSQNPVATAELTFTKQTGKWQDRLWETAPATIEAQAGAAKATLPEGVAVYYFNLFDEKGRAASSEHQTE
jgi:dienelactone hydrolase